MLDNHSLVFKGMMAKLQIDETIKQNGSCDFNKGFNSVAEELFVQNEVKINYIKYILFLRVHLIVFKGQSNK